MMDTSSPCSEEAETVLICRKLSHAVVMRDCKTVKELTERVATYGVDPIETLNQGLILECRACERFRKGEYYIAELLMSSRALRLGLSILRPLIRESCKEVLGKVVIGTVKFDLHDIGKNLVIILLEGNGFEIIDLGVDVSPEKFIKSVEKNEARILAMSSLLTSTVHWVKTTIDTLHARGIDKYVKTLVGGQLFPMFAKNIGADGYCRMRHLLLKWQKSFLK